MTNPSIWDPSSDTVPAVRPQTFLVEQTFYAEEGQTSFTLTQFTYEPNSGTLRVYVNGSRITGVQETSASTFSLPVGCAAVAGDKIFVEALLEEVSASQVMFTRTPFTATAGQTEFVVNTVPGKSFVYLNGAKLSYLDDYAETGTKITLVEACSEGDFIEIYAFDTIKVADMVAISELSSRDGARMVGIGGGRTQADKNAETVSVKDFGASLDGVTDDSAAIVAANTAALSKRVPLLIPGVAHVASPITITVPIIDGLYQIFSSTSQVTIDNGMPIRPDWWGDIEGSVRFAINALPATGGVIQLEDKVYKPNGFQYGFGGTGVSITKDNVKIVGRGMPQFSNDCKSLIGGSIIQGQFSVYANNFEARDFGIDSGKDVLDTYYGGVSQPGITEGFGVSYPNDTVKFSAELRKNIRLHNIISLASGPSDQVHAFIIGEGVKGVECSGHIIGCMGYHGIVIKCADVRAEQLTSYCNAGEGVIIKSDSQATAVSDGIQIGKIKINSIGPDGYSPYTNSTTGFGVMFNPEANTVSNVQIGEINVVGHLTAVGTSFGVGNNTLRSVSIGSVITDQYPISGGRVGLSISGDAVYKQTRGFHVGRLESKNATYAFGNSSNPALAYAGVHIGSLHAVNCEWAAGLDGTSKSAIGDITTENVANGVFRFTGDAKIKVGSVTRSSGTATLYSNISGGLVPALAVDWSQHAGNDPFGVDLAGGRVHLRGLIQPTASSTIFASLPRWARPSTVKRFVAQGVATGTNYAVPVVIGTDGLCSVNEVGGGVANCQQWLSLAGISWDIDS